MIVLQWRAAIGAWVKSRGDRRAQLTQMVAPADKARHGVS